MAEQGYSRTLTFVVNDKQIKRATDRLFQSLDRIEKKLDVIAGKGRGSRTGFTEVQRKIEGTNKELALLTKTASTAQSKFNNLQRTFELFGKAVYGLNQARLIAQKGLKGLTDDARTGFLRLNREIGKTYLMLDPKKRVQLGGQFKDLIEYRSMQGAGPGSPQFRNDGRLRGSGYSTRKSLAGIGGDGPYSFMYPVNTGGFGGNTFRYEMNKRLALRQQGLERGGTGFASFSRDATYESAWQREFRARLQDQVDRRNFNLRKTLPLHTARLSEAGGGVASGASLRTGASDPVSKSIRRHRERMDKLRKVELKTTKELLGTEKQILAVKKSQTTQVNATAYAPGAIGPRQSLYNRLGFGKAADPRGAFANSRGRGGRISGALSSGMIGGGFPLLFGQGGLGALGGGIGGLAGGALGGGFGFGFSIVGTALASAAQDAIKFQESIDKVNNSIRRTGSESLLTAKGVKNLATRLDMTKEEVLAASAAFAQFDGESRLALTSTFGKSPERFYGLAEANDAVKVLEQINKLRKEDNGLSDEKARKVLEILNTEGAIAARIELRKRSEERSLELQNLRKITFKDIMRTEMDMNLPGRGKSGGDPLYYGKERVRLKKLDWEQTDKLLEKEREWIKVQEQSLFIAQTRSEIQRLMDPMYQLRELSVSVGNSFAESFKGIVNGSMSAQQALANLFQRTADHFLDMAAQMIAKQIQMKILGIGFDFLSNSGSWSSNNVNPLPKLNRVTGNPGPRTAPVLPRALGGPVSGGSPYVVGERGPELFVPNSSGNIVPNNAMGGANIVVNVDASGSEVQGNEGQAAMLGRAISSAVTEEIARQKRPGGLLSAA